MTLLLEHPHHQEINTPWEPQPIAWRYHAPDTHTRADTYLPVASDFNVSDLSQQAQNPKISHLVREVMTSVNQLGLSGYHKTVPEVVDELKAADEQFAQLESLTDIRVAPTEWHVFKDKADFTRVLARVEIIDGPDRTWPDMATLLQDPDLELLTPEEYELLAAFESGVAVYSAQARGRILTDIELVQQYKYGVPRTNLMSQRAFYLIDIEPRLSVHPQNV